VITPELSVITNIGYDHAEFLGDTLELIAKEKAGIIKRNIPVVISERQNGLEKVFTGVAKELNCTLHFGDTFKADRSEDAYNLYQDNKLLFEDVKIPLLGNYQIRNIPGVMMALKILEANNFNIEPNHIRHGLENVITQTQLKGRWQILSESPMMICDTGHNEDGIRMVVEQLKNIPHQNLHVVRGVVKDKAIESILKLWPTDASYYFCEAKIPRALDANILYEKAQAIGLKGEVVKDVNAAIAKARATADKNDVIFIGGSTFVVADIENL
jgi:dihydrofolate synthase/folylpolyglutamate synthase